MFISDRKTRTITFSTQKSKLILMVGSSSFNLENTRNDNELVTPVVGLVWHQHFIFDFPLGVLSPHAGFSCRRNHLALGKDFVPGLLKN